MRKRRETKMYVIWKERRRWLLLLLLLLLFIHLFLRERLRIPSRLSTVRVEPDAGRELTNHEIMT